MSSAIELKNIIKTYPLMSLPAVKDISLTISEHELVALMGASGSGKSTLLNMMGLLDRPTAGQYRFYGKETELLSNSQLATMRNESIGFIFQSFFLLPHITIEKNIALPLLYRDYSLSEATDKARKMLEKMHLMHLYHRRPNQLSGGEQQRIAIARALIGRPKILLADEPTGALDSRTGEEIMDLFFELYEQEKKTVIIATHNFDIAQKCHRLIILKDGQIIQDQSIGERHAVPGLASRQVSVETPYIGVSDKKRRNLMRRIYFYLEEAFANFMSVKFRSLLTVLSLLIGTASVVAMIYGGELATAQSLEQFKTLGTDLFAVNVYPSYESSSRGNTDITSRMNLPLLFGVKNISPKIRIVEPYTTVFTPISFEGEALESSNIIGCDNALAKAIHLPLLKGRFISSLDRYSLFCVLGHYLYEKIKQRFPNPIGRQIQLGDHIFTVIGVTGDAENSFVYADLNRAIFIPLAASILIDPRIDVYNVIMKVDANTNVDTLSNLIQKYFAYHAPDKKLYIRSAKQYIHQMEKQRKILTILLGLIGSISLVVGGIGVMNIMVVSVAERRREIGIRLAMGADRQDIQWLFLIEAVCLSLIGGTLGIVMGLLTAFLVAHFQHWSWEFFFMPLVIGFGVSSLIGIIFGSYPAYRASQLTPIETLRSE